MPGLNAPNELDLEDFQREYIARFLGSLSREDASGKLNDIDGFARALSIGLDVLGLTATQLANDEGISQAAISKWLNKVSLPTAPARKTVINWIKRKGDEKLRAI